MPLLKPDCQNVVVIDNATLHHTYEDEVRLELEAAEPNARLEFLPPYSPELNPVRVCAVQRHHMCKATTTVGSQQLSCAPYRLLGVLERIKHYRF